MSIKVEMQEWARKSKRGENCGIMGCFENPVKKCDHCGLYYCEAHSVVIDMSMHQKKD